MEEPNPKKQRGANFTLAEKEVLVNIVSRYKNIIENKKTDALSIHEKNEAWENVCKNFNAAAPGMRERSMDSLKKYYKNQKEDLRKRLAKEKIEIFKTGGGLPPTSALKDPIDQTLISIINQKSLQGVEDKIAPYDDDFIELPINFEEENSQKNSTIIRKISFEREFEDANTSQNTSELKKSIPQLLKSQPPSILKSTQVCDSQNSSNIEFIIEDSPIQVPNPGKGSTPLKKHQNNKKQIPSTPNTPKNTSRRRPTVVRTLTSSKLGDMDEKLIEKKMELLEGLKQEHEIRLENLKMDKEIKLIELRNARESIKNTVMRPPEDIDVLIGESVDFLI